MSTPDQPQGTSASPDLKALLEQGKSLLREGQTEAAVKVLQEVLQKAPDHADALLALGSALAQQGNLQAAAQVLERAVATAPQSAAAHFNLGVLRLRQGQRDRARGCFQRALEINPQYSKAQAALAELGERPPPVPPKASPVPSPAPPAAEPEEGGEICPECGENNPPRYTQCQMCGALSKRALAERQAKEETKAERSAPMPAGERKALRLVQGALALLFLGAIYLNIRDLLQARQWGVSPALVIGMQFLALILQFVIPMVVTLVVLHFSTGMQSPEKAGSAAWMMGVAMVLALCLWDYIIIPFFGWILVFVPFPVNVVVSYFLKYTIFYLAAMVVFDKTVRVRMDMAYGVVFKILLISAIFITPLQIASKAAIAAWGITQTIQEATSGQGSPGKPAAEDIPLYPGSLKGEMTLELGPMKMFAYTVPNTQASQVVAFYKEQMSASGWTLQREQPGSVGGGYELTFVKKGRECSIAVTDEAGGAKYMIMEMQEQ